MRKPLLCGVIVGVAAVLVLSWGSVHGKADAAKGPQLVHGVYFTLKERTPQNREKLIAACKKYLTKHPGTVYFAAGPRAEELKREVNDVNFDVALVIVFENQKAHDQYQVAQRHQQFIAENKALWKTVRVFDSTNQAE